MEKKYEEEYKQVRPNSIHLLGDARCFDYKKVMDENNFPKNLGFLQIDIEVCNDSTIDTLKKLDNEIFDYYKFATVCFEHDFYCSNWGDPSGAKGIGGLVEKSKYCRDESRKIFTKRGYYLVFNDLDAGNYKESTEDWWVHPDLIDMKYIKILQNINKNKYRKQIKPNEKEYWINYTGIDLLNYKDIVYPNYYEYKISEVFNYVKKKIKKLEIKTSPYEHVCINDFFPEDFYNETLQEFNQIMEEDNKLKLIENEDDRIKKQVIFQNKVKIDYITVKIINY